MSYIGKPPRTQHDKGGRVLINSIGAGATIDFDSGIDSTYERYEFVFVSLHPASSGVAFEFQVNAGDTGYNDSSITNTFYQAYHTENDSGTPTVAYSGGNDSAASASMCKLFTGIVNDDDSSGSGLMTLYHPSSDVYIKNWTARFNFQNSSPHYTTECMTAGYIDDPDPITAIRFQFSSGAVGDGMIYMYGVKNNA
tara:strand:- start:498 stop:1085 length:588 start_codon:yes stop_codon:yes gene_type:complete